jgi:hypothetical protein
MGTKKRADRSPTWRSAVLRGAFGAVIFMALLVAIFRRPIIASMGLAALMLLIYIPLGFYMERFLYNRRLASKRREREGGE